MVRLFVAVTDKSWFDQLSASAPHDEVNFWQPSGTTQFRALQPGELFPLQAACAKQLHRWRRHFRPRVDRTAFPGVGCLRPEERCFQPRRDADTNRELSSRLDRFGRSTGSRIGCRILTQPFFWSRHLWLPVPESWSPNIVTGKGFSAEEKDGQHLWSAVTDRLSAVPEI